MCKLNINADNIAKRVAKSLKLRKNKYHDYRNVINDFETDLCNRELLKLIRGNRLIGNVFDRIFIIETQKDLYDCLNYAYLFTHDLDYINKLEAINL